jgi:hypothetical protein
LLSGSSLNKQINQIYYFSTQEGLVSHLFQLQNLWYASLPYHSNIKFILVPWRADHFPDVSSVSLCDYFALPEVFSCDENRPYDEVAKSLPPTTVCELMNATFGTKPEIYHLNPNQVKVVQKFHFDRKPSCIGGYLGFYPGGVSDKLPGKEIIMPWKFRNKYIQQVNRLKQQNGILSENSNEYAVFHWRRGDQLTATVRCAQPKHTKSGASPVDTSVNCGSVETFIEAVRKQVHRLVEVPFGYSSPIPIYIATNENNRTILDSLAKESFILGDHLFGENNGINNNNKQKKALSFNAAEKYVMELILMCDSRFLFTFGTTSSNSLAHQCRHLLPMFDSSSSGKKVTFHNGVRMNFK